VVLVSSDLARARETAAFLEKETGLTATEDARLREYDLGERTGMTREEFVAHLGDETSRDVHAHVEVAGAETQGDVAARIVPALHDVLWGLATGETAVVVSHGACLKIAVAGVLGLPVESSDVLATLDNCAWVVLEDSPHGRLRLASYNLTVGA
jgi:broad specificity phosphatase PhoE